LRRKHELESASILLSRTSEVLQILEKQREIFNDLLRKFNVLEVNNLVTINDVSNILRRIEVMKRVAEVVKRYLIELGKEGMIISMRLRELVGEIPKVEEYILEDYFGMILSMF
jgi:diadenylate cyclase